MPLASRTELSDPPVPPSHGSPSPDREIAGAALRKDRLTGGMREPGMDRVAALAADLLGMPYSLVTVSLGGTSSIIGGSGLELSGPHLTSLCALAQHDQAETVTDTRRDGRLRDDPLVTGPPFIRSIACAPLSAYGQRAGSLCVMDVRPRKFSAAGLKQLSELAALGNSLIAAGNIQGLSQRELAERTELLRTALDSLDEGIAVFSADGRLAACSEAYFNLFNLPIELRHVGTPLAEIVLDLARRGYLGAGDPDAIGQTVVRSLRSGKNRRNEIVTPDGRTFSVSRMIRADGRIILTCLDVTARKTVERTKDELVSAVSHELRTPLTSITGSLGLLMGGAAGDLPERAVRLVKIAHSNAERLTKLVNELLDIDSLDAGVTLKSEPVDLNEIASRVIEDCRHYALRFDVELRLQPAPEPVSVMGDADRLHQVISNLLSNAVKHSPQGGAVTVAVTRGQVNARLSVIDHGSGIPEAFRAQIFRRFAQLDPAHRRVKEGTGLGLAISRAIIERHGGSIGFKSEEGKGSTFFFELPAATALAGLPATGGRSRILLCEDDQRFAREIMRILHKDGSHVDIAASIGQALDFLEEGHYDALVTDLLLPDGHGLDLIREVRTRPGLSDLPVLVVSEGARESRSTPGAGALNVIDWIDKDSFDAPRLAASLAQAAAHGAARRLRVLHVENEADLRELVGVALPDGKGAQLITDIAAGGLTPVPVVILSAAEPTPEILASVRGALIKSRTSIEQLAELVRHAALNHPPGDGGEERG